MKIKVVFQCTLFLFNCYIIVMIDSDLARHLSELRSYVSTIDTHIDQHEYRQALLMIRKATKQRMDTHPVIQYNLNANIIEELKEHNENLKAQMNFLNDEKEFLQKKHKQLKRGYKDGMKPTKGFIFISRFPVTLNDTRKVQYEPITLGSDFKCLQIQSEEDSFENYPLISMKNIYFHQKKQNYVLVIAKTDKSQDLHCLFKLSSQAEASIWSNCIYFSKIIEQSKEKKKLFMIEEPISIAITPPSEHKTYERMKTNPISLGQSRMATNIRQDKSDKHEPHPSLNRKIELNRPSPLNRLNRLRGRSQNAHNDSQVVKKIKVANPRKASGEFYQPKINQEYHERMIRGYKKQKDFDQISAELNEKRKQKTKEIGMPKKIDSLIKRKADFLSTIDIEPRGKIKTNFQKPVTWLQIEEKDDENKSKTGTLQSKDRSDFSKADQSSKNQKGGTESQVQNIEEKSEEQSPTLVHKIAHDSGTVFKLIPITQSVKTPDDEDPQDEDFDYTEPAEGISSQDNHTESEANNHRMQKLKQGLVLMKCAQNGYKPHQKNVYLSQNEQQLCCRDLDDKKVKKIMIKDIESVDYGLYEKGVAKHIKRIQAEKCLLVKALAEDKSLKKYQFVGDNPDRVKLFSNNLKEFVKYYKQKK